MPRLNVGELTEDEVLTRSTQTFFKRRYNRTPAIPASFDGKYVILTAVVADIQASEAQMDTLETAIEGLPNVHKAFCLIGPARIPLDRLPAGAELVGSMDFGWEMYIPQT